MLLRPCPHIHGKSNKPFGKSAGPEFVPPDGIMERDAQDLCPAQRGKSAQFAESKTEPTSFPKKIDTDPCMTRIINSICSPYESHNPQQTPVNSI